MSVLEKILNEIEEERGIESDYSRLEDKKLVRHWNNCIDVVTKIIRSHMNDDWIPIENGTPEIIDNVIKRCFVEMKHVEGKTSFRTMINWVDGNWQWDNGKRLSDKYQILAWQKVEYPLHYCKIKDCSTCKNNVEFPPPHTCDICTSLNEEDYCMWESKIEVLKGATEQL